MNKEAKDEIKEDHGAFSDRRAYTFDGRMRGKRKHIFPAFFGYNIV